MKDKKLVIAVDFDGTLCEFAFPKIGEQTEKQKELMSLLIEMRNQGHKLILWTNRGDNEEYPVLTEAIEWCKEKGLEFYTVNEKKLSGPSPKIMADFYIDDKALKWADVTSQSDTLNFLHSKTESK
jgi:2-hydroxy-3-keto-5-methylthiopentenyl-1-phosphate phosphatase